MNEFSIELARKSDDDDLKDLVANTPMDGEFQIALRREPSYFHGVDVQGPFNQVGVARDKQTGQAVGCATRSVRPAYLNGEVKSLGYIGGLRLKDGYRGGTLLARGYRAFRQLHQDNRTPLYVTTIIEENPAVRKLLTSERCGLPRYHDWGQYHTLAIRPSRMKKSCAGDVAVERGSRARLAEIVDCLNRNGRQMQFYPHYSRQEFFTDAPHLRDFNVEDFYLAVKAGRVVGAAAIWDQNGFKQTVVAGYKGKMRVIRPFYNLLARFRGLSRMPPPGSQLNHFLVSFVAVDSNDTKVFRVLLAEIHNRAVERDYAFFLVGFHERDPLLRVAEKYPHFAYLSRLYVVCWKDAADLCRSLDDRVPYLELATL